MTLSKQRSKTCRVTSYRTRWCSVKRPVTQEAISHRHSLHDNDCTLSSLSTSEKGHLPFKRNRKFWAWWLFASNQTRENFMGFNLVLLYCAVLVIRTNSSAYRASFVTSLVGVVAYESFDSENARINIADLREVNDTRGDIFSSMNHMRFKLSHSVSKNL